MMLLHCILLLTSGVVVDGQSTEEDGVRGQGIAGGGHHTTPPPPHTTHTHSAPPASTTGGGGAVRTSTEEELSNRLPQDAVEDRTLHDHLSVDLGHGYDDGIEAFTENIDDFLAFTQAPPQDWYVSLSGDRSGSCGQTSTQPCRNLAHVINIARDYDIIHIDGTPGVREDDMYSLCHLGEFNLGIYLQGKSLHLLGENGKPRLGCGGLHFPQWNINSTQVMVRHQPYNKCHVRMENLYVENGFLPFSNCTVDMHNVLLNNASIKTQNPCHYLDISIINSGMSGGQDCNVNGTCIHHKLNKVVCMNSNVLVLDSQFNQSQFVVDSGNSTNITVLNSVFSQLPGDIQYLGGLHLTFANTLAHVLIQNCTFEHQVNPKKIQSVVNLYEAALWLKVARNRLPNTLQGTNAYARVLNCTFAHNERGITTVGPFAELVIEKCFFRNNIAMHAGAGMLVLINGMNVMRIVNCTFENNVAGKYRDNYPIKDSEDDFQVVNSEVHLNADCCKGVISLVGKGGGIRVQRGNVEIRDSKFVNNTARLLGGSVFVDMDGNLTAYQTYFENTPIHDHALQGDILYSDGIMLINDVEIIVKSADNGLSIFRHAGDHWSLEITNVWMQCPQGYDLRATNSSAYGVANFGLKRSHKLDQLSYFCESCPRNKYSLDYGYLNYTMVYKGFAYFTLLINGSVPKPQYTGEYIHHIIKCSDCPYGGHCVQGISAVANFWGYVKEGAVKFQHCPKGYCCHTSNCPGIDGCEHMRAGTLCGRCRTGYSEALFSPICVPNDACGPTWLMPFGIGVGTLYAIFLLFQADLQQFLFGKPLGLCGMSKSFKRTYRATYMNGNATTPPENNTLQHTETSAFSKQIKQISIDKNDENAEGHQVNDGIVTAGASSVTEPLKPDKEKEAEEEPTKKDNSNPGCRMLGFGSGFLVIMFYYYQDALMLNVKTVFVAKESKGQQLLKSILSGIFKFQLDLFQLIEQVCAVPDMTAVQKTITKAMLVPYVIVLFAVMYVMYKTYLFICSCGKERPLLRNRSMQESRRSSIGAQSTKKSFGTRLSSGFILALLFMFQKMGTTTFIMLNCVPVKNDNVLYIDGTVTCYQYWQYGVMAYAVGCVSPFFIVLCLGPMMLERGQIGLTEFFFGCLLPLPVLILWICRGISWHMGNRPSSTHLAPNIKAVLQVLQGPFKENQYGVCWSGVLVGRRLVLILLYTFVADSLIRLLGMLLSCFIILLHHVHVQPYKDYRGNIAGTTSAAALVTLGAINLVRAGFEAAEYTPTGPNEFLMRVFTEIENLLLMWMPLMVSSFFLFIFIIRCFSSITNCLCRSKQHSPVSVDSPTEENNGQL